VQLLADGQESQNKGEMGSDRAKVKQGSRKGEKKKKEEGKAILIGSTHSWAYVMMVVQLKMHLRGLGKSPENLTFLFEKRLKVPNGRHRQSKRKAEQHEVKTCKTITKRRSASEKRTRAPITDKHRERSNKWEKRL